MKKVILASVFLFIMIINIEATMVSFCVVEAGLIPEGDRNRHSISWENTLLEVFFEAGYIVSNYPMMRFVSKPDDIVHTVFDYEEAREGGLDYVLIALLQYSSGLQAPAEISFYVFKVTEHKVTYEKHIPGRTYRSERDQSDAQKTIIRELLQFINGL